MDRQLRIHARRSRRTDRGQSWHRCLSATGLNSYFGIVTHRGCFNFRITTAIYAAYRIRQLVTDSRDPAISGIGAGGGLAANYATKLGIKNYTIIDLPNINVLQAFILNASLPGLDLALYGEPAPLSDRTRMQILPPSSLHEIPAGSLDLAFMQDNMPEFERGVALGYPALLKDLGVPRVLDIQQEAQAPMGGIPHNRVADLFGQIGGFRRNLRLGHWLGAGSVEEIYENDGRSLVLADK